MVTEYNFKNIRSDVILAVATSMGSGFVFVSFSYLSTYWVALVTTLYVSLVVLLIIYGRESETKIEKLEKDLGNTQKDLMIERQKKTGMEREESTNLLSRTVEYSTSLLRSISDGLQGLQVKETIDDRAKEIRVFVKNLKPNLILGVLKNIRLMFEGDSRAVDTTTYPHNYFKAALFEVTQKGDKTFLHRTFYDYPEGIEPSAETEWVDVSHPQAGSPRPCLFESGTNCY